MKKNLNKIIAVVMTVCLALSLAAVAAGAADKEIKVVVSLEGITLGQGFYIFPKEYTVDEINALVADYDVGTYTADTLTAGVATLACFVDNGIDVSNISGWTTGLYMEKIKGIDKGYTKIPSKISEVSGVTDTANLGNSDEYLGSFDYSANSGWMFTVNGVSPWVSADAYVFSDYDAVCGNCYVLRWQYSIYGWGVDIGGDTWGMFDEIDGTFEDVSELYVAYAENQYPAAKADAEKVMSSYLPSAEAIDGAVKALNDYSCGHLCHSDNGFLKFIWKIVNFFNKLFKINKTCSCGQAHY